MALSLEPVERQLLPLSGNLIEVGVHVTVGPLPHPNKHLLSSLCLPFALRKFLWGG